MASQWHYRWKGEEKGPVSFQDLAQLVRSGGLSEDDLVRREHASNWERARDVIGLLRAAGKEPARADAETGSLTSAQPPVAAPKADAKPMQPSVPRRQAHAKATKGFRRIGKRGIPAAIAVAVAALLIGYWRWQRYAHPLFPRPPGAARAPTQPPRHMVVAAARAARSNSSSVPGLESGVPRRVPGLEAIDAAGSLSLTDDLGTIVFGAAAGSTGGGDLWISSRVGASKPFKPPVPIESCNSPRFESKPSISPDGLEMLFARGGNEPQWLHAKRSSRSLDFGEPRPWVLSGLPGNGRQITVTRFLDALHVLVSVDNGEPKPDSSFYVVERPSVNGEFGPPREIPLDGCSARVCLRPNRLLAYFGTAKGIFVQGRDAPDGRFSRGHCLFGADVCGPVQGAIWVAPGDDVAFYVSPGPAQPSPEKTSIWMIRF